MLNDAKRGAFESDLGSIASALIHKLSISSEEESLPLSKEERDFLCMDHIPTAGLSHSSITVMMHWPHKFAGKFQAEAPLKAPTGMVKTRPIALHLKFNIKSQWKH